MMIHGTPNRSVTIPNARSKIAGTQVGRAAALLVLRLSASAYRSTGVHPENVRIRGEEIDAVVIGAFGSCNCLVDVKSSCETLPRAILALYTVLVN